MNKPLRYLFALLILTSCDQSQPAEDKANFPKQEVELIQQFNNINNALLSQNNEVGKKAVTDSGFAKISTFVKKDLNFKAQKWVGYVEEVTTAPTIGNDAFEVNVFIPMKESYDKKYPTVNAITLRCRVKGDDKTLMEAIKILKPFDKVLVTGKFESENNGNVNIVGELSLPDENSFSYPQFGFNLTQIVKQ